MRAAKSISCMLALFVILSISSTDSRAGEKICCYGQNLHRYSLNPSKAGFWTKRDLIGNPISAESGERLEVWWTGFFPHYELRYYRGSGDIGREIGRCHFMGGCNNGFFFAPDNNNNGIPDCFAGIEWESIDCSNDGDYGGHFEQYRHVYNPCTDTYIFYKIP